MGQHGYGPAGVRPNGITAVLSSAASSFDTKMKDASVFVDGGYAERWKLKRSNCGRGSYNIELRDHDGHSFYQSALEGIAGKTLKLVP